MEDMGGSLADANGLSVNKRKGERTKVKGGVEGGQLKIVVRYIHFLKGVYLYVKVISGSDLIAMDSNGLSDPYVKVRGSPFTNQPHFNSVPAHKDPKFSFFLGGGIVRVVRVVRAHTACICRRPTDRLHHSSAFSKPSTHQHW